MQTTSPQQLPSPADLGEEKAPKLDANILVRFHVVEVEGLLAAHRLSFKTLAVPNGELQLHKDVWGGLPSEDPVGSKPVVSISLGEDVAVLVHVHRGAIDHLLNLTPLHMGREKENKTRLSESLGWLPKKRKPSYVQPKGGK